MSEPFQNGLEVCLEKPPESMRSGRFGLLMNRASVDRRLSFSCDLLADAFPGQLAALLTPQHGWWGDAQANMIESDHDWHRRLDVPDYSLYSETRRPTAEMLVGLDCLVIDLQDVGTRVYTYIWTMLECLHQCAAQRLPVVILDRPNPIGGRVVEGPFLGESFRSFVGGATIPMRHGLTIGELARWFQRELTIKVDLEVIPMRGWNPEDHFDDLGQHWLPPSPNLPTVVSALVYPGQVLLEGTNLSEGRGTTTPFEVIGAPFLDAEALIDRLDLPGLEGVTLLPTCFRPTFDKWQGELCSGVSMIVTDRQRFRPFAATIAMLSVIKQHWPERLGWLPPPYEYETEKPPIDILYGSSVLRETLGAVEKIETLTEVDVDAWTERTAAARLYGSSDRFTA